MPAPKKNKFALGNSGKPKKYKDVAELQKVIDAYFYECDSNTVKEYSKYADSIIEVPKPIPYTIEGLAYALDITRATLLNYEKKEGYEEFFYTLERAKSRIQKNKLERGLMGESVASVTIFDLKNNHEYKDQSALDLGNKDGQPFEIEHEFDYKKLNAEQLKQLISILESTQSE